MMLLRMTESTDYHALILLSIFFKMISTLFSVLALLIDLSVSVIDFS